MSKISAVEYVRDADFAANGPSWEEIQEEMNYYQDLSEKEDLSEDDLKPQHRLFYDIMLDATSGEGNADLLSQVGLLPTTEEVVDNKRALIKLVLSTYFQRYLSDHKIFILFHEHRVVWDGTGDHDLDSWASLNLTSEDEEVRKYFESLAVSGFVDKVLERQKLYEASIKKD